MLIRSLAALAFCLFSGPLLAANYVQVKAIGNFDFGSWDVGLGPLSLARTKCIASANVNGATPTSPSAEKLNYNFKIAADSGAYYIYRDDNVSTNDNARIAVTLQHKDDHSGNIYATLKHNDYLSDSHSHTGQFKNCVTPGLNSTIRVLIQESDILGVLAGAYTHRFRATAMGGTTGTKTRSKRFRIRLTVPQVVQITGLDELAFGVYNPAATPDLNIEEEFCVYTNHASGLYDIRISSANAVAGNFFLISGPNSLPYQLQYTDDILAASGINIVSGNLIANQVGSNSSFNCGAGHNAKLIATALKTDLQARMSGAYLDTLLLRVTPL